MISRDTSPPPLSDDSAISSLASSGDQVNNIQKQQQLQKELTRSSKKLNNGKRRLEVETALVSQEELTSVSTRMRYNNTALISRSIRTHLHCFDDLDTQRFEKSPDYLVNFISIGVNKCASSIQRPVSILWPVKYNKMVEQLAELDAYLINTEYLEKPIEWMLKRRLTYVPKCHKCKLDMSLIEEKDTVKWQCHRTPTCFNTYTPIQRPNFFRQYEHIGLMKIFFSIYFWSTCTQFDYVIKRLSVERQTLHGIWRSIQNVCRVALENPNCKFQLSNNMDQDVMGQADQIDLISIKVSGNYVVCAKHPNSNKVRLGLIIPNVSTYSFVGLTKSWFAFGSSIRVCEAKFLALMNERNDLKVSMVTRTQMMNKDGVFDRNSAFGYLICQLTHTFKDFESSTLKREDIKLVLNEIQWRELYGTTPIDAFTNIVEHIAKFEPASECYLEPTLSDKKKKDDTESDIPLNVTDFIYAEKHFYASLEPIDEKGNIIRKFPTPDNMELAPKPVARFFCHLCNQSYESFYFSIHMIEHVERNRKENLDKQILGKNKMIECKHCFKPHNREDIINHSNLLRTHLNTIKLGCRICCIKFKDRAEYLKHMRRTHFKQETPYRCPSCKFASSFQREVFIHFQEEHRHSFKLMCPFCLKGFTVEKPDELTPAMMQRVSTTIYSHVLKHYVLANSYCCNNCCLSFLSKDKLQKHLVSHHNPLEVHDVKLVKLQPFIVSTEEEPHCIKAMPSELFIANKRPNVITDELHQRNGTRLRRRFQPGKRKSNQDIDLVSDSDDDDDHDDKSNDSDDSNSVSSGSYETADEGDKIVHVRNCKPATKFLDGGKPALKILTRPPGTKDVLTSEKIIEYMSVINRADGVIANQSVILTPEGMPSRCVECMEFMTVDHLVAQISCKQCRYSTHCPRAATKHQIDKHKD